MNVIQSRKPTEEVAENEYFSLWSSNENKEMKEERSLDINRLKVIPSKKEGTGVWFISIVGEMKTEHRILLFSLILPTSREENKMVCSVCQCLD